VADHPVDPILAELARARPGLTWTARHRKAVDDGKGSRLEAVTHYYGRTVSGLCLVIVRVEHGDPLPRATLRAYGIGTYPDFGGSVTEALENVEAAWRRDVGNVIAMLDGARVVSGG